MKIPDPEKWLLANFAGIIVPWQDKISSIELISSFYKPHIQIAASIYGALAGTTALILWRKSGILRLQKRLFIFGIIFVISLMVCMALSYSVGILFEPDREIAITLRFFWPALYIVVNASFAICVSLILVFALKNYKT